MGAAVGGVAYEGVAASVPVSGGVVGAEVVLLNPVNILISGGWYLLVYGEVVINVPLPSRLQSMRKAPLRSRLAWLGCVDLHVDSEGMFCAHPACRSRSSQLRLLGRFARYGRG